MTTFDPDQYIKYDKKNAILEVISPDLVDKTIATLLLQKWQEKTEELKPIGVLLDVSKVKKFNSAAIERARDRKYPEQMLPMAVIGASELIRLVVNYLAFTLKSDFKFTRTREEAYEWLLNHKPPKPKKKLFG